MQSQQYIKQQSPPSYWSRYWSPISTVVLGQLSLVPFYLVYIYHIPASRVFFFPITWLCPLLSISALVIGPCTNVDPKGAGGCVRITLALLGMTLASIGLIASLVFLPLVILSHFH